MTPPKLSGPTPPPNCSRPRSQQRVKPEYQASRRVRCVAGSPNRADRCAQPAQPSWRATNRAEERSRPVRGVNGSATAGSFGWDVRRRRVRCWVGDTASGNVELAERPTWSAVIRFMPTIAASAVLSHPNRSSTDSNVHGGVTRCDAEAASPQFLSSPTFALPSSSIQSLMAVPDIVP
jgi:hypothetical protein